MFELFILCLIHGFTTSGMRESGVAALCRNCCEIGDATSAEIALRQVGKIREARSAYKLFQSMYTRVSAQTKIDAGEKLSEVAGKYRLPVLRCAAGTKDVLPGNLPIL